MISTPQIVRGLMQMSFFIALCLVAGLALYPNLQLPEPSLTRGFTDKIYHVLGCAVLALLAAKGWRLRMRVLYLAIPLSVGLEFIQGLVPGRGVHFADMLANLAGVILAILILSLMPTKDMLPESGVQR